MPVNGERGRERKRGRKREREVSERANRGEGAANLSLSRPFIKKLTGCLERLHSRQGRQRVDEREGVDEVEAKGGEDGLKVW